MSLISDALRKARQEAADREAKEQGLETPVVAGYWKRGGHPGVGLLVGAVIAVGAAGIGGSAVWWLLLERPEAKVVAEQVVESSVPIGASDVSSDQQEQEQESSTSDDETDLFDASESTGRVEQAGSSTQMDENGGATKPIVQKSGVVDAVPKEAEPSPVRDFQDERGGEFIEVAKIGDVTLTLDYLLFRAENPFAQINGRDVRVGSVIEGFVIEEITADSVAMRKDEKRVVLRVR